MSIVTLFKLAAGIGVGLVIIQYKISFEDLALFCICFVISNIVSYTEGQIDKTNEISQRLNKIIEKRGK